MRGRATFKKRKVEVDKIYGSVLAAKFINRMMKDGKKTTAENLFYAAMEKLGENPLTTFEKALQNVGPRQEIKARRVGGASYQIPMEVKPHRQITLAFRWLIKSARDKKGKEMANKLAEEIEQAADNQGNAIKKKEDTHKMAKANKAFAHYARY